MCDVIIPADEKSPSASKVGVPAFHQRMGERSVPGAGSRQKTSQEGLVWLNAEAPKTGWERNLPD